MKIGSERVRIGLQHNDEVFLLGHYICRASLVSVSLESEDIAVALEGPFSVRKV